MGRFTIRFMRAAPAALCLAVFLLTGCITRCGDGQKLRDLEFTVLDKEDVPEELGDMIEKEQGKAFRLTYEDQGYLYIAEGYGTQPETGYSVKVEALYETEDAVHIRTVLLGPAAGEETQAVPTYPYVAVQIESAQFDAAGKEVLFD